MWKVCLGANGFISGGLHGYRISRDELLDHAVELGYDGLELHGQFDPLPEPDDLAGITAYANCIVSRGLEIAGIQASVRGAQAFSEDRQQREAYVRAAIAQVDLGHRLGGVQVGFWPGGRQSHLSDDQIVERLAECFKPVAERAEWLGVMTTIEPEPVQIDYSYEIALRIVEAVGSPNFKILFDCAHAEVLTGNAVQAARRCAAHSGHVHFCDSNGTTLDLKGGSHSSAHLAAGDGRLDLAAILRALKEGGYRRWIQVDTWENPDPFRCSRLTKRALDEALKSL